MSTLTRHSEKADRSYERCARSSNLSRHPMMAVIGGVAVVVAVVGIVSLMPDIVRYIKISRM